MKKLLRTLVVIVAIVGVWYYSGSAAGKTNKETKVNETVVYKKCGHEKSREYPVSEESVGHSGKEIAEGLNGEYISFKNNVLSIKTTENGYCENHFRTFIEGNLIKTEVIKTGELVSEYRTAPSQYSENDMKRLSLGIITDSPEALSALLEDYTS